MKIRANSGFTTIRQGHADFSFSPDGMTVVPRAGFEISAGCPYSYRQVIAECVREGWLRPVAHMRDTEYTVDLLRR